MRRIKLELAYDGSNYHGWQTQKDFPTIQKTIELKLEKVLGHKINLLGSGRTDAGVHALKQVATFSTDSEMEPAVVLKALNAHLPRDIRVRSAVYIPWEFHPINDVVRKRYRYLIDDNRPCNPFFRKYCWTYLKPLNVEIMKEAAKYLLGTHDFSCFETQGSPRKSTVRTIYDATVERTEELGPWAPPGREKSLVVIEVEADGFLYNMVRAIAGSLALVGSSETRHLGSRAAGKKPEWIGEMIASKERDSAGPTAPPEGLYMLEVKYE